MRQFVLLLLIPAAFAQAAQSAQPSAASQKYTLKATPKTVKDR
jgi:hypothetical protein